MVLSLLWLASVPTVGYGDGVGASNRPSKLQQYVNEALAQAKAGQGGAKPSDGHCFGSPLPSCSPEAPGCLGTLSLPQLALGSSSSSHSNDVATQQQQQQQQQGEDGQQLEQQLQEQQQRQQRGRRRRSGGWQGAGAPKAGVSSPAAIASPRAASVSTVSAASAPASPATTPDSCSRPLAQAAAAAGASHGSRHLAAPAPVPSVADSPAEAEAEAAPSSPGASSEASSPWHHRASDLRSLSSLTHASSLGEGGLPLPAEHRTSGAAEVDLGLVIRRLREPRQTGQVCAWGWEHAARLSHTRRSMPTELFSALWASTQDCAGQVYPQDVLCILESWLTLLQTCPRHFRLRVAALDALLAYSVPAAVKRMTERQLAQLAGLCSEIALHRCGSAALMASTTSGPSARDLMQPIFALAAAEVAWRCCSEMRYVSVATLAALDRAAGAWSWRVVRHRDRPQLAALKVSTARALELLQGHMP